MRSLAGLRVLLTRPVEQAEPWAAALEAAGASVVRHPTIEVLPPPSWEGLDDALARLADYDWLVFTSRAAVAFTATRLPGGRFSADLRPRVAAVGQETARALHALGARVALIPDDARQEGLVAALGDLRPGTRVLFPQALGGRDDLRNALLARNCVVDVVAASQTVPRRDLPAPAPFDVATFASPSSLRAFVAAHGLARLEGVLVAVIGPTTCAAAEAFGLRPMVADRPNVDSLIQAISAAQPRSTPPR